MAEEGVKKNNNNNNNNKNCNEQEKTALNPIQQTSCHSGPNWMLPPRKLL